jgi:DMSO/TMAO reductase YedYZ molybdopterin-dependent catalytic subunit
VEASNRKPIGLRKFFLGGVIGGVLATIMLFLGTDLLGYPFPPLAIFQLLIAPVPGSIQSVVVETFREYAKYSTFVFSSAVYVFLYGVIGILLGILVKRSTTGSTIMATLVGTLLPSAMALGLQLRSASAFSAISSTFGWITSTLLILAVNIVYSRTVLRYTALALVNKTQVKPLQVSASSRRGFLKKVGVAAVLLAVGGAVSKIGFSILFNQPVVTSNNSVPTNPAVTGNNLVTSPVTVPVEADVPTIFSDPRISSLVGSEISDNRVFYRVDIDPIPPQLDLDTWRLKVHGKVSKPLTLNDASFNSLPTTDEFVTLECVSNTISPPGSLISNAKWSGVSLANLLNQAGILPDAKYVIFRCGDGYTVGIPVERAMQSDALLAYKMNDVILPKEHGFPLRAIVPGIYGMMNAKWITEIEATDQVYLGYWQERGWSNDARIKTTSIIYHPQPNTQVNASTPIAGVAFAGDRGISKVEVSVDGGNTWNEATLKKPHSPYSWVLWAYEWTPASAGTTKIVARAYDGSGRIQDQTVTQPFPDGASGYQSVQVTVA